MTNPNKLPRAIAEGVLMPGVLNIPCAVLDDGRRVLTTRGIERAIGAAERGQIGRYLAPLKPFLPAESVPQNFDFIPAGGGHGRAFEAQSLIDICKAYLHARRDGALRKNQEHLADKAQEIVVALAGVGIAALVDEATGYEAKRPPGALQRLLAMFVRDREKDGLAAWEMAWPESLDRKLCLLYGWPFDGGARPAQLASVRLKIYRILQGKDVVGELQRLNPNPSYGKNHHQLLTDPARKLLEADLRTVEDIAEQSRTPVEFFARLEWKFNRKPFQFGMGWA